MNNKQFYVLLFGILVLAAAFRFSSIRFANLFSEPDVYYYYSVLTQAHGLTLPSISIYDGAPPYEAYGLYLLVLIPHVLTGLSISTVMLLLAPLFGVVEVLLTYLFARELFPDRRVALLSAFFVAILPGALNYQISGAFRGDSFLSVFLLVAMICLIRGYKDTKRKVQYAFAAAIALSLATVTWSGGAVAVIIFAGASVSLSLYSLYRLERDWHRYPIFTLPAWVVLFAIMNWTKSLLMKYPQNGFAVLVALAAEAISLAACFIGTRAPEKKMLTWLGMVLVVCVVALLVLAFLVPSVYGVVRYAFSISHYNPSTINVAETQPSSLNSIVDSYGFLGVLSPAILLVLYQFPLIIAAASVLICYLIRKPMGVFAMPLAVYLAVALLLNSGQVRFVSIAIVPVSVVMAYLILRITDIPTTKYVGGILLVVVMLLTLYMGVLFIGSFNPAYEYRFIGALQWLKSNTPSNSTVLAFWSDGSEIEGVANRFAYSDSVAMQLDPQGTSLWLTTSNASLSGFKPPVDYILLRAGQFGEGAYFCNQSGQPNSVCNNMENPQYLAETQPNFYRIWFACNVTGCTQSLGNETLSLVYATTDTKIFKVD